MNRLLGVIGCLCLLLAACSGRGTGSVGVEQYQGTGGLIVSFEENSPPEVFPEERVLPVRMVIRNTGAHTVPYNRTLVLFGANPYHLITRINPLPLGMADPGASEIQGKSIAYPQGELRTYPVPDGFSFETKRITGQFESPKTQLVANVCYAYATTLSTTVCIDTTPYDENVRAQPCEMESLQFTGGQGAPIAVTGVDVEAFPVVDRLLGMQSTQPHFTIHIKNLGNGHLMGPDTLPIESACLSRNVPQGHSGAVRVKAYLLSAELECSNDLVRVTEEGAEVRCTVSRNELGEEIYSSAQNFQTVLTVNLTYYYKTSAVADIEIIRNAGNDPQMPEFGKVTGYLYEGDTIARDASGNPITLCAYYGQNPDKVPPELTAKPTSAFSCSCGIETCTRLARDGRCLAGLCPGNTFCCNREEGGTSGYTADNAIAQVALNELAFFGGGRIKEGDAQVQDRIAAYFAAGNCAPSSTAAGTPWSAAFISYVMQASGASFPGRCSHTAYFAEIRDNPGKYSCTARPISEIGDIKPGDVLCACRGSGCRITFEGAANQNAHCDIVTAVHNTGIIDVAAGVRGGDLVLVGGNVGDSVAERGVSKKSIGSGYFGFLSCS